MNLCRTFQPLSFAAFSLLVAGFPVRKLAGVSQSRQKKIMHSQPEVGALIYEPNTKHKEPWQPGQKGTLCPPQKELSRADVAELLKTSVPSGQTRYACREGKAYAAHEHQPGRWHGHPVGWVEVPHDIRLSWVKSGKVRRQDIKRNWGGT
jgi:hypothetical protein